MQTPHEENGQYGKATKALLSLGTAPPCAETTAQLQKLHPIGDPVEPINLDSTVPLMVETETVINALRSFPKVPVGDDRVYDRTIS